MRMAARALACCPHSGLSGETCPAGHGRAFNMPSRNHYSRPIISHDLVKQALILIPSFFHSSHPAWSQHLIPRSRRRKEEGVAPEEDPRPWRLTQASLQRGKWETEAPPISPKIRPSRFDARRQARLPDPMYPEVPPPRGAWGRGVACAKSAQNRGNSKQMQCDEI